MARGAGLAAAFVLSVAASSGLAPGLGEYRFCHDGVLGTSLDLTVVVDGAARARACEAAVLSEVERLRRILSTYDPASEISRLNTSSAELDVSPELFEVLSLYELWQIRTGGIFNVRVGSILQAWKRGEKQQRVPDPEELRTICRRMEGPALTLDRERRTARRLTSHLLGINAIGKNYILEKAVAAALAADPAVQGILLSIGGDIVCRGSSSRAPACPWRLGVVDPRSSHDNAPPLVRVLLRDRAIASSGSYERYFTIGGTRYSTIMDPRSGQPAGGVLGATVIAPDAMTADALSTTLCILSPAQGLDLVGRVPGAECVITSSDGATHESPGWRGFVDPAPPVEIRQQKNSTWPDKFQLSIELSLAASPPTQAGKPYRRPYLAVWVEDPKGKPVRTIAEWGNNAKHQPELSAWWGLAGKDAELVKAVSKATRDAGKYTLVWDGLDDKGNAVPQGAYVLRVEVSREFGRHFKDMTAPILCKTKALKAEIKGNTEVDSVKIIYGPQP
jgi:thiamine biosynthesis lipoprotein ApbE